MKAKEFGEYIRGLRKSKKITIRQIELYEGVSNSYLSLLENGKRGIPSPDILKKLSKALDVNYEQLMEKAGYLDHVLSDFRKNAPDDTKLLLSKIRDVPELRRAYQLNMKMKAAYQKLNPRVFDSLTEECAAVLNELKSIHMGFSEEEFNMLTLESLIGYSSILDADLERLGLNLEEMLRNEDYFDGPIKKDDTLDQKDQLIKLEIMADILKKYNLDVTDPKKQKMLEDLIEFAMKHTD